MCQKTRMNLFKIGIFVNKYRCLITKGTTKEKSKCTVGYIELEILGNTKTMDFENFENFKNIFKCSKKLN